MGKLGPNIHLPYGDRHCLGCDMLKEEDKKYVCHETQMKNKDGTLRVIAKVGDIPYTPRPHPLMPESPGCPYWH